MIQSTTEQDLLLQEFMIPKIAHFIWLGGPLPQLAELNINQFRSLHPDWTINIWMGLPPDIPSELAKWIFSLPYICMRSDIIRLWLLNKHGGIFLDTDVFPIRPFDTLLARDFFAVRSPDGRQIFNGVMGAPSASPALAFLTAIMVRLDHRRARSRVNIRRYYGPTLLKRMLVSNPRLITVLPAHYFYIFHTAATALQFVDANESTRRGMIRHVRKRMNDKEMPFAVHTWGIPRNRSHTYYTANRSTWEPALSKADLLLQNLPFLEANAAILGAGNGRLAAYLLGHHPRLNLFMVEHPDERANEPSINHTTATNGDSISADAGTNFAQTRRTILKKQCIFSASEISEHTLDAIHINVAFQYQDLVVLLPCWLPKLKDTGVICFPPINFDALKNLLAKHPRLEGQAFYVATDGSFFVRIASRSNSSTLGIAS